MQQSSRMRSVRFGDLSPGDMFIMWYSAETIFLVISAPIFDKDSRFCRAQVLSTEGIELVELGPEDTISVLVL